MNFNLNKTLNILVIINLFAINVIFLFAIIFAIDFVEKNQQQEMYNIQNEYYYNNYTTYSYGEREEVFTEEEFELTAYCGCEKCCGKSDWITASGSIAKENHTIAVDTSVIPFGTLVEIDGTYYVAEDTGGSINGNRIDIYFDSHQDAIEFGVKKQNIKIFINLY